MRTSLISISNVIGDWVSDNGLEHEEVDESVLVKWGIDALGMMNLVEQLRYRIVLLQVEHSRATLPLDFKTLLQAAANVKCDRFVKTKREQIVEWVQGTYEKDCHLKINLVCDKCKKDERTCGCEKTAPRIEVDVDRIWEMAHPEIYYKSYQRIGRFGYGPQPGSMFTPKFELMRATTQDFHKVDLILGDCPNIDCKDCERTFRIEPPYLEVDFDSGEVLLSYLGRALDDKGDPLIPDHPDVLEAIQNHIDYKWYNRVWKKSNDQFARIKKDEALQSREINMGIAKSVVETPEFTEVNAWIHNQFYKRFPDIGFSEKLNKRVTDQYDIYGKRMRY